MEKLILINCKDEDLIKSIAGNMRIKTISASLKSQDMLVGDLVKGEVANYVSDEPNISHITEADSSENDVADKDSKSLILFCDVTDKHFDKILSKLREKNVTTDYKAVLTKTNEKWTLKKLLLHLKFEKMQSLKA